MSLFYSPWYFLLLLPLIAIAVLWLLFRKRSSASYFQFSSLKLMKLAPKSIRARLAHLPWFLKLAALVFLVVALARPRESSVKLKRNVEGIDIVIALDISDSMLIEDMVPENRLEASKETIRKFIQKRQHDRLGLVVFSGESYTRVPMTLDYPVLLENLSKVQTTKNIKMGTAIGVALSNAVGRLKDSGAKSKVVIFLTDGENNSGIIDPLTAIDLAEQEGVKVYSIGMGKDGQAQLPITQVLPGGRKRKVYRPIHSKINEKLLGLMAERTGGKYYRAITSNALQEVFDDINRLERTKIQSDEMTRYKELFPFWAYWALLLFIIGWLLEVTWLRRGP